MLFMLNKAWTDLSLIDIFVQHLQSVSSVKRNVEIIVGGFHLLKNTFKLPQTNKAEPI